MFCTSLRRRPSFSTIIPTLSSPSGLALRESALTTHDISLPLVASAQRSHSTTTKPCTLRILLLSSRSVSETSLPATLQRIQHFTSLTGGQDLALVLLLSLPPALSFVSAKTLTAAQGPDDTANAHAYATLQSALLDPDVDISPLPILPLSTLSGLPALLQRHASARSQVAMCVKPPPPIPRACTARDLLALCSTSTNPPGMVQRTKYIVVDLFVDLASLAEACVRASRMGESGLAMDTATCLLSSASQSEDHHTGSSGVDQLMRLRELIGERELVDMVEWWKTEWALD